MFKLPAFDLVEHQVQFDGEFSIEREQDRAIVAIPSLPPRDRILMSFVFSPDKAKIESMEEVLLSVRASNCLGRLRGRAQENLGETIVNAAVIIITAVLAFGFILQNVFGAPLLKLRGGPVTVGSSRPIEEEVVRFVLQAPDTVLRGKEATIEVFVENATQDPFTGWVEVRPPLWSGGSRPFLKEIAVAAGKRHALRWTLSVPETVLPGKYELHGEVSGRAFRKFARASAYAVIDVK